MIEEIVLNYLKQKMDPIPAWMEVPEEKDAKYILIEKIASEEVNRISTATLAIQSIADSMYNAAALNEEVKQVMAEMIELDRISKVKLSSDYNFTNTQTKQYRYQAVFDITYC